MLHVPPLLCLLLSLPGRSLPRHRPPRPPCVSPTWSILLRSQRARAFQRLLTPPFADPSMVNSPLLHEPSMFDPINAPSETEASQVQESMAQMVRRLHRPLPLERMHRDHGVKNISMYGTVTVSNSGAPHPEDQRGYWKNCERNNAKLKELANRRGRKRSRPR